MLYMGVARCLDCSELGVLLLCVVSGSPPSYLCSQARSQANHANCINKVPWVSSCPSRFGPSQLPLRPPHPHKHPVFVLTLLGNADVCQALWRIGSGPLCIGFLCSIVATFDFKPAPSNIVDISCCHSIESSQKGLSRH